LGNGTFKGVNNSTGITFIANTTLDNLGNLYVGGRFNQAGDLSANNVAKWDGSAWSNLTSGTSGGVFSPGVYALCSDNQNNIYIGGEFTFAGGILVNRIAKWNGSSWSALGSGIGSGLDTDIVFSTIVDNSNNLLYAAGTFNTAGGITANNIAVLNLNSSTWSSIGAGSNGRINSLALDNNNNLYVGGLFTNIGGVSANYIARWDGSSWSSLSSPFNVIVNNITFKNGKLYACGAFTETGSVNIPRLAVWDGISWTILNVTTNNFITDLAVNNNDKIYLTGFFTTPGNRIAQQIQTTTVSSVIIPSESANSKSIGIL